MTLEYLLFADSQQCESHTSATIMTEYTAHNKFEDEPVEVPEHVVERTENLLSEHPMTNQRIILDTAQWWLEEVGNCPIYRWCINWLNHLEHDTLESYDVYVEAKKQAEAVGIEV